MNIQIPTENGIFLSRTEFIWWPFIEPTEEF